MLSEFLVSSLGYLLLMVCLHLEDFSGRLCSILLWYCVKSRSHRNLFILLWWHFITSMDINPIFYQSEDDSRLTMSFPLFWNILRTKASHSSSSALFIHFASDLKWDFFGVKDINFNEAGWMLGKDSRSLSVDQRVWPKSSLPLSLPLCILRELDQ